MSLLLGLQTFHPFAYCPSWAPIGAAPLAREGRARCATPRCGAELLAEVDAAIAPMRQFLDPERAFPFGDHARLRAGAASTASPGIARAQGRPEMEVFYDALMDDDGHELVLRPLLNYTDFSLDAVREMLLHPTQRVGSRRRRRALRHHVRREHAHVHAHALGARPRRTIGSRSSGS